MMELNHNELAAVAYSLMFLNNKDKVIWRLFIERICTNQLIVPLPHYYPIKLAFYYINSIFKNWDQTTYLNSCLDSENYFSIVRTNNEFESHEYKEMSIILTTFVDLNYSAWIHYKNLFIIGYNLIILRKIIK